MSSAPTRLNATAFEQAVAEEAGVTAAAVHRVLDAVRDVVAREIAAGNSIAITNFGTWLAIEHPARYARNPQTGGRVLVPGKQGVKWRTSPRLAEIVAARDTEATTRKRPSGRRKPAASEQQDA
jgi:DNA-binding protein HU-beta